jgi:hypothetical protein
VKPYHGRLGSFPGALIKSKKDVILGPNIGLNLAQKAVRHLNIITLKKQPFLLVSINNDKAQVYKIKVEN